MAFTWPSVLIPRRCDPHLRNMVKTGGRTSTGREQRVFFDAGYWIVPMSDFPFHDESSVRAWRSLLSRLRQGQSVNAKIFDAAAAEGGDNPSASATLSGSHAVRATSVTMSTRGIKVTAGVLFSIGNRLHQVDEVVSGGSGSIYNPVVTNGLWNDDELWNDGTPGSVTYSLKISPPLRSAYASGTAVRFSNLTLECVVDELTDGELNLDLGLYGNPSLTLRESI
jgi:hypothetical protein